MLQYRITLCLLLISIVLSSCTATRQYKSSIAPSELENVGFVEPICYFEQVAIKTTADDHAKVSEIIAGEIKTALIRNGQKLKLGNTMTFRPEQMQLIEDDAFYLYDRLLNKFKGERIKITEYLDDLMEVNNQRFLLLTIAEGYVRTDRNFRWNLIGQIALTLIDDYPTNDGQRAESYVAVILLDSEKNEVAYFNQAIVNRNPTKGENWDDIFAKIFDGYL